MRYIFGFFRTFEYQQRAIEQANEKSRQSDIQKEQLKREKLQAEAARSGAEQSLERERAVSKEKSLVENQARIDREKKLNISSPDDSATTKNEFASEAQAITVVQNLYQYLSDRDWSKAVNLYGLGLKYQFSPEFFSKFEQVNIEDLHLVSLNKFSASLIGENTYFYSDKTTQRELRSFTVTWENGNPLVTGSEFIRVTKLRD